MGDLERVSIPAPGRSTYAPRGSSRPPSSFSSQVARRSAWTSALCRWARSHDKQKNLGCSEMGGASWSSVGWSAWRPQVQSPRSHLDAPAPALVCVAGCRGASTPPAFRREGAGGPGNSLVSNHLQLGREEASPVTRRLPGPQPIPSLKWGLLSGHLSAPCWGVRQSPGLLPPDLWGAPEKASPKVNMQWHTAAASTLMLGTYISRCHLNLI